MSHLDTAYKLGAMRAIQDFQTEVEKSAQGLEATPPPRIGGAKTIPAPPPQTRPLTPPPSATALPGRGTGTRVPPATPLR